MKRFELSSKSKFLVFVVCCIFSFVFLFAGCGNVIPQAADKRIRVVFEKKTTYFLERQVYEVEYGEDLKVMLSVSDGFSFYKCDYADYEAISMEKGKVELLLRNIYYPQRIKIETIETENGGVYYFLNGGNFIKEGATQTEYYIEYPDLSHHLRANTSRGSSLIERDGYTLLGWNTQADGRGEHIGLGSRVTVLSDESIFLYAEWKECLPESEFVYTENENDCELTGYRGRSETDWFVLPEYINGKKVVSIAANFATTCTIGNLVLPHTLHSVAENAFVNCSIDSVYMCDNLEFVRDDSFDNIRIRTLHLNAAVPPRLLTNDNSHFAEDMDRLILNAEKKKMVLTGGCSLSYGIDSPKLAEAFPDYFICNMGVIGGTNGAIQIESITKYLQAGDVMIHTPEPMSPFQLMYDMQTEKRIFMTCEGNYDLLSLADMRNYRSMFNDYYFFNELRKEFDAGEYTDYNDSYNEYGDIGFFREKGEPGSSYGNGEVTYEESYVTKESVERLCYYYDKASSKGAKVFFSYAPVNIDGISSEDKEKSVWKSFDQTLKKYMKDRYPIISEPENYLFEGEYFYDTDYHLCSEGAVLRTERLIEDIRKALQG